MLSFNVAKKQKQNKQDRSLVNNSNFTLWGAQTIQQLEEKLRICCFLKKKKRKKRKKNSIKFCRRRLKTTTTTVTIYRTTYITHLDKLGHEAGPQCREQSRGMRLTCDFLSFQTCKGCWLALVGNKLNKNKQNTNKIKTPVEQICIYQG